MVDCAGLHRNTIFASITACRFQNTLMEAALTQKTTDKAISSVICDDFLFHGPSLGAAHGVLEWQKLQKSSPDKHFP